MKFFHKLFKKRQNKQKSSNNNFTIYDKAKWHFDNFSNEVSTKGLDIYQGYVLTGFLLGALIELNLISNTFKKEHKIAINDYKQGKISSTKLYEQQLDGVLTSKELNKYGNNFIKEYFESGIYYEDISTLFPKEKSSYIIKDNKKNYDIVRKKIIKRYEEQNNDNKFKENIDNNDDDIMSSIEKALDELRETTQGNPKYKDEFMEIINDISNSKTEKDEKKIKEKIEKLKNKVKK